MGLFRRKTQRENLTSGQQCSRRLHLEVLESRLTPAVLSVDASHSFVSQLAVARAGDTLQLEPSAVIGTLGTSAATTAAANVGDTTLQVNAAFAAGQVIAISDLGDTTETDLVDAVSGPVANVYTLTLHSPLADAHQSSSSVVAAADTLGISKGITIQGDPKYSPSSLLVGTNLEYFTQNGSPAPDALIHLKLTAVEGTTSSNLTITGDSFAIATGSTDAINVDSGAALTIGSDTFTVGSAASLTNVVSALTDAGAIDFASDVVSCASNLGGDAISLSSTSGPIDVSSVTLSVSGTIAGDGLDVETNGDLTVAGTNRLTIEGAITGSALEASLAASTKVSNVTAVLSSDAGVGGITIAGVGSVTASNLNVTVEGSVDQGMNDFGAAIDIYSGGLTTLNNLTGYVEGKAGFGLYIIAGGDLLLSGKNTITVSGVVIHNGVYIFNDDGNDSLSGSLTVELASSTEAGIEISTDFGTIVDDASILQKVAGNVTGYGIYFLSNGNTSIGGSLTVDIGGTADIGVLLNILSGTVTNTGPIAVTVIGEIGSSGSGLSVAAQSGVSLSDATVALEGASAGWGAALQSNDGSISMDNLNLNVSGAVADDGLSIAADNGTVSVDNLKLNVTGAVADDGLLIDGENATTNDIAVDLDSTANDGILVETYSDLTMTNTAESVGGAVAADGADLSAGASGTVNNLKITLAKSSTYGLNFPAAGGNLSLSGFSLTETGAPADAGVSLACPGGNATFSNSTIDLNGGVSSATDDAVAVVSQRGDATISGDAIEVAGSSAAGLNVSAAGSLNVLHTSITTGGGTALLLTGSSGNPQTIEDDTFNAGNTGTGLAFSGGSRVVALVQGDNFQNDLVGVAITGDGTYSGVIDLGGGLLGSQGKNNFSGYTGASGHYSIALNSTNATSTVYALHNTFSIKNPAKAVQDAANGSGTGIIDV